MDFDGLMDDLRVKRTQYLTEKIRAARYAYTNSTPIVPDEVYDAWMGELSELLRSSPEVLAIGAPVEGGEWEKASHDFVMGSLDKVNLFEELQEWFSGLGKHGITVAPDEPLLVTEKLDGISINLRYQKGEFVQAITRGDGFVGEDISRNVSKMKGVVQQTPTDYTGSIRGEIILSKSNHEKYFQEYANTRNGAGGIARRSDGTGSEHLTVMVYQVVGDQDFVTEMEQFLWLEANKFLVPHWGVVSMVGSDNVQDYWLKYQESLRDGLNYDIDGLVVRLNDLKKQTEVGDTNGRPRGARAYKFAPITRETELLAVEWQVGGTGRLTPVATFTPVTLVGASVSQASLYNWKYVREMGLGIGSRIIVARANDVIPRVMSCLEKSSVPVEAPKSCPACGGGVSVDGEYLICSNAAVCPAQKVGRIQRYVNALDIKEWGEGLIEKLVSTGLVSTPADLYLLSEGALAGVDRMGVRSAQNVLKTLWAKECLPLEDLLGALSIPGIGSSLIRLVMDAGMDTWEAIQAASVKDFEAVQGLGPVRSENLFTWLSGPGKGLVEDILSCGVSIRTKVVGSLSGQTFCFTGTMKNKRKVLEEMVTSRGGVLKPSVSKGLTYLVQADASSTKAQAAKKYGTSCISEDDFLRMVQ